MAEFVSILQDAESETVVSVTEAFASAIGAEVLDLPALDDAGRPLPPRRRAAAEDEQLGYEAQTVDELKAEIDRRNEGRGEDAIDRIPKTGNKADLVAALEADDVV